MVPIAFVLQFMRVNPAFAAVGPQSAVLLESGLLTNVQQ